MLQIGSNLPFIVDPFSEGHLNNFDRIPLLNVYPLPFQK